jgi:uncharacterized repeat protein (TIGR03803 family)
MKSRVLHYLFILALTPSLVFAQAKIWGITNNGGSGTIGTVYNLDSNGTNQSLLKQFAAENPGSKPFGDLIEVNGKLYGLTSEGGNYNKGVIFSYDLANQQYAKLFDFDGTANGANPKGKLMLASDGFLYGVTSKGGANEGGVLFSFDTLSNAFVNLHDFTTNTGIEPDGGLVEQSPGVLFGVTYRGGNSGADFGVLYKYNIALDDYQPLHDFNGSNGENPTGTLCVTPNGYLMGLTTNGGLGKGVVFGYRVSTSTFTNHYTLTTTSGGNPEGSLLFNPLTDKCYGLTAQNGANSQGTLFSIDTNGTGFSRLYDFVPGTGGHPKGKLSLASGNKLIGNTYDGGSASYGTVFTINTDGSNFDTTGFYDFFGVGANPYGGLFFSSSQSKYYGLTSNGGNTSNGMLVSVDPTNFNLSAVFSFNTAGSDGGFPVGGIIKGVNGKVYGTTSKGGTNDFGTAFQLDADGTNFIKMAEFTYDSIGTDPRGSLVEMYFSLNHFLFFNFYYCFSTDFCLFA